MGSRIEQSIYELLGLDPEATTREVREAYRKRIALFDPSSPVLYGLYTCLLYTSPSPRD